MFTHSSIVANIASLYQETISTFSFRINVGGDPRHLQNAENAAKIRALLLAGIRAAMLWRQVGGAAGTCCFSSTAYGRRCSACRRTIEDRVDRT
ncbi:DUF489 family protein [Marinobacterium aestuariivivens]|uniref:DUF489 family protein n=1 Tax=Marinobacterium aestuariivivens TaxID=1698799 RepID=A0ABW2A6I9_9GAMM